MVAAVYQARQELVEWLLWLHAGAGFGMAVAYIAISIVIFYFLRRWRRADIPYRGIFSALATAVMLSGLVHLVTACLFFMAVFRVRAPWVMWAYLLAGGVGKLANAVIAAPAVMALRRAVPAILNKLTEFDRVTRSAAEGIARVDVEGRYMEVNFAYAGMFGADPKALEGKSWCDTVLDEDLELMREAEDRMKRTGRAEIELRGLRADGGFFHKRVTLVIAEDLDGRYTGYYSFAQDITERKQAEEAAHTRVRELEMINRSLRSDVEGVFDDATIPHNETLSTAKRTVRDAIDKLSTLITKESGTQNDKGVDSGG